MEDFLEGEMIVLVDRTKSLTGLRTCIDNLVNNKKVKGLMILACDGNDYKSEDIDPVLKEVEIPLFGGIFPEIIYQNKKLSTGVIVAGLTDLPEVTIIPDLSDENADYETLIDERFIHTGQINTMFIFVDGLSKRIASLIDAMFNIFGLEMNYIGGGAGSLSFKQKPCLFSNEGLLMDQALIVSTTIKSGVGVNHGWEKISGPYTVTESNKNEIISLDWRPAFNVYREVVEKHSGRSFDENNFFDIAKSYPFGIHKLETENIVRDPLMKGEKESLVCVGEVPENSIVDILTGYSDTLITASKQALSLAEAAFPQEGQSIGTTFFIDCISRVLFLEDNFQNELDAVYKNTGTMIGALTLGEIANSGRDYLEFYNKTAVVGVLDQ